MRSRALDLAAILGLVVVVLFVFRVLGPGGPDPVTVRGGSQAKPLAAAIADFRPEQIVSVLPPDAIPAIDEPELEPAAGADLDDGELVIGVELGGQARAYPIRVLSAHEIVNDEIAGKPYAVTW